MKPKKDTGFSLEIKEELRQLEKEILQGKKATVLSLKVEQARQ